MSEEPVELHQGESFVHLTLRAEDGKVILGVRAPTIPKLKELLYPEYAQPAVDQLIESCYPGELPVAERKLQEVASVTPINDGLMKALEEEDFSDGTIPDGEKYE